ncbi:hypothetical protein ABIE26_001166 [Pedobacter africanus]|uniref:Uncharacterized protein n=1 Tax=Pedobacter africanus TaxID=151894 RepID=A0ACC6KT01_9SPHI|nr:hypothetical protein [Pedobacter africanus]MDR6782346.1 hypothetical protein [Pedobacter africanus]
MIQERAGLNYICSMSLPMRITFEGRDYTYTVLTRSISKDTKAIRISLEGQEYELGPNIKGEWDASDITINDKPGLLKAIARILRLRYRLY